MSTQPTIHKGSKGSAVTLCQQRLTAKGFVVKVDGDFGQKTEDAVEQFQASCGLDPDGIVGPMTWNFLMAEGTASTPEDVLNQARSELAAKIPADAHPNARKVLETAIGALGKKEIPDGSNGGPELAEIVEWEGGDGKPPSAYYLHWRVSDKTTLQTMPAWCAIFVCWAIRKALGSPSWQTTPMGNWYGGCSQWEEWAKKNGRWKTDHATATIPAGAAFTISREQSGSDAATSPTAGHIGLVVCDNGDGTVTTIEGNVSNKVGSSKRKKSVLRGYVTWW